MPVSFSGEYSQNFNGLASSGTNNSWTNDVTLPGWHLFRQPAANPVAITAYNAGNGDSNAGSFYSFGSTGSNDRALGGAASGSTYFGSPGSGAVAGWLALALTNASGSAINGLNLSFSGEQWRNGGNTTAQSMVLEYGYGVSFAGVSSWLVPGGSFNWTSPLATSTAAAVDGNLAGQVSGRGGPLDLSANPWAPGDILWFRWIETNDSGNDHGLAIDDLTLSLAQPPALPEVLIQALDGGAGESGDGASVRISRSGSTAAALEVPLSLVQGAGLALAADLSTVLPTSVTIPAGASSVELPIAVLDDALDEGSEILRLQITAPSGTVLAEGGGTAEITIADNDRISLISAVQGSGATSPLVDQSVTLRAVVVGDFQLSSELGGFFLQEESADWDGSGLTSEGLYVAYPLSGSNVNVALGDRVLVSGLVGELFGQTAITSVGALSVEAPGRLSDTRRQDIPDLLAQRSASLDLEPYEGMWVRFPETLTVNGLYGQFRFGEVELSAGGLPLQPTNGMEPGPAAYAAEQATALRELVLDDGSNSAYRPASAATAAAPVREQLLRRGDLIAGVEGVLAYGFSKYRLHPTAPLSFTSANPRPAAPAAAAAGQLRLASYNVLNTFTTLNAGGALTDTGLAPRGANSPEELERQLSKLTAALLGLQADVIGLMELENDADDTTLAAIVQRLNAAQPTGSGRSYSFVPTGLIGTDAIKVGLIYNNLAVAPSGSHQVLSSSAFVDPLASGTARNRPALAQAFRQLAGGEVVNVVVNHLKSKGASEATGADLDQLDGQSAWNATRTAAASALLGWINTNPTGNSDRDWVILGDLNAYAKEDPIQVLEAAGYRNVLPSFTAEPPSSYAFYNPVDMSGALDHMLISPSLVPQAVAASGWAINAAEGAFRDYNLDSNSNGDATARDFYAADAFRTSDHDPLLLDLQLGRSLPAGLSFSHGVASGDPYADSVILWTRITPPSGFTGLVDVQWELASSADFAAASIKDSGSFATGAARDWTVKVEADGLVPDTTYYYRFRAGESVSITGQTKTLPVGSDPVRLAVFSCANFTAAEEFAAYGRAAAIHEANPYDALVHLGDYIYEYGPGGYGSAEAAADDRGFLPNREILSLDDYRQRYAHYHTDSNLQALRAAAPLIAGWDDHETANNSWSGGAQNHQGASEGDWIARRDAALKAYHEWLPIREPGHRQASDGATALSPLTQAYRSFSFGDVLSLHMLETRLTARDQQLDYPSQAAVQARIGAILADPAQLASYATKVGVAPPTSIEGFPAFGAAIAPLVTQELVIATVQQAWGDPSRDLIGDTQLGWLQQQMAGSSAAWQVLGQQVLMQSMAVPSELLLAAQSLDFNDPASGAQLTATLDRYAAPLQKLATGTPFASLSAAEQALFAEAAKIPYNLDAWDGYGVERETILQTALALGKSLISLAGDTHNAWAGLLDTMSAGAGPAGTLAGVEFGTPGVTSPGLEKILPGADAYIRAMYPAVDGLDGLFMGYVNRLNYADLNRRGFLDLTITPEQASGSFQLLSGTDPVSGAPVWTSETVLANRSGLNLTVAAEAIPEISWQSLWQELDLFVGIATDSQGSQTLLDPAAYASVPRAGVRLADVRVVGSAGADQIHAGIGSRIDAGGGPDELFTLDSLGDNLLVGGAGADRFMLRPVADRLIGGSLLIDPQIPGLEGLAALVDREADTFLIDSSDPAVEGVLELLDFEPGLDALLLDGGAQSGSWLEIRQRLAALGVRINAAPAPTDSAAAILLQPGSERRIELASLVADPDGDALTLALLEAPAWVLAEGSALLLKPPAELTGTQLASASLRLRISDGKALIDLAPQLTLAPPLPVVALSPLAVDRSEGSAGTSAVAFVITRSGELGSPSTVDWQVLGSADPSADAVDFGGSFPSGQSSFAAGQSTATLTINLTADSVVEPDEGFTLALTAASGASLDPLASTATGTIRNDDTPVSLALLNPADVAEDGSTNLRYVFSRAGDTGSALTVNFSVGGSAAFEVDYGQSGAASFSASSGSLVFAVGAGSATLQIDPSADALIEPNESVLIALRPGAGYQPESTAAVSGTLLDDDASVSLSLLEPAAVREDGSTNLRYVFRRTGSTAAPLTVRYRVEGTATTGTDYQGIAAAAATRTLVMAAGAAAATLSLDPSADTMVEPDETVVLSLLESAAYAIFTPDAVTGTIRNDDISVSLRQVAPVLEDGSADLAVVFERSGDLQDALSVTYTVAGTATLGTDYTGVPSVAAHRRLGFAPGAATATLLINPTADNTVEGHETVVVTLAAGSGYSIGGTASVSGTIRNDDATVSVSVLPASVSEDGNGTLVYSFSRMGYSESDLTVSYGLAGSASAGVDYSLLGEQQGAGSPRTVTFAAGSTSTSVVVDPIADTQAEANETVLLNLLAGSGYAIGTPASVSATISNDDLPEINVSVEPATVLEDGSASLRFLVARSGPTSAALSVNVTVAGTASLATDYSGIAAGTSRSVRFAAGASIATVTVDPTADNTLESDETVILTLAPGSGYQSGGSAAATGTIANDDARVSLTLAESSVLEDGSTNLVVVFERSGYLGRALSVNYTAAGTATLGTDYSGIPSAVASRRILFQENETTATLVIDPTADSIQEGNETVVVTLAAGSGYSSGGTASVSGTIRNDDLTGTSRADTLSGSDSPERLDGLAGRDTLTGGGGVDEFRFRFGQSGLAAPDRLTDFSFGSERIAVLAANGSATIPTSFSRAADNSTATSLSQLVAAVFSDADGAQSGNQALAARGAALVVATQASIAGTYLMINDPTAGRNEATDLLINLTGFSGTLPAIGAITPIASVFV